MSRRKSEARQLEQLASAHLRAQQPPKPVKAPKVAPMLEKHIQTQIVQYLRLLGWTVWEMYTGSAKGGPVWMTPGVPDLYVFKGAQAVWFELKRPQLGRLSAGQILRHAELKHAGLPHAVVTSIEEVQAVLRTL